MRAREVPWRYGFPRDASPGDYTYVPPGIDPRPDCVLYLVDPTGGAGAVLASVHTLSTNEARGLTITPSLVMPSGWHGFLTAGELA